MSLKRLSISIAMAAVVAVVVAACGGGTRDDDGDRAGAGTEARGTGGGSGETVSIVASVPPTDHGWLGAISKNAQAAADQYDDVEFELLEAADADSQAQQIEQVISEKPDALVVLPQDGEALTPVAQKAEAAGIPVINVDRLFSEPDAATATILGDNYQIGVLAADYIARGAQLRGQRRRNPGPRRDLGHRGPDQGVRRTAQEELPRRRDRDRRPAAG